MLQLQHHWKILCSILVLVFISLPSVAAPDFPELTGRVVDNANLLPETLQQALSNELAVHEKATSNQVVVVTLTELQGYSIEDYGNRLGRHWGIGSESRDNGVLLIVAPQERKLRIEVGYGLEATLTDALSHNIIQTVMLPLFKSGEASQGVMQGARAIVQVLEGSYEPLPETRNHDRVNTALMIFISLIGLGEIIARRFRSRVQSASFIGVVAFVLGWIITGALAVGFFVALFTMVFHFFIGGGGTGGAGRGGYDSHGYSRGRSRFSAGGGFSGGGGSFGGGGASGGW